jgi:prophage DNA circulation protein
MDFNLKSINPDSTFLSRAQNLSVPGLSSLPSLSKLTSSLPSLKLPSLPALPSMPGLSALGGLGALAGLGGLAKAAKTGDTSWRSRVSRASFRGVSFLTENHDSKGGRRLVIHEYPGAEVPDVEDMGGKSWEWRLTAYFIGPNYDRARNDFLARLAKPGADWLMHPWLGLMWVRAHTWSVHDAVGQNGYSAVTVDFVDGGARAYVAGPDRVDVARSALSKFAALAKAGFKLEGMSAAGLSGFIASIKSKLGGLSSILSLAKLPLTFASQLRHMVASIKGDIHALMALPAEYAAALGGLADDIGLGGDQHDVPATSRPRIVSRVTSAAVPSLAASIRGAASTPQAQNVVALGLDTAAANALVTEGAVRRNLVREEALRSQLLVCSAGQLALTDYEAAEDRDTALVNVVLAMDALLPDLPDELFQAALTARSSLIEALMAQDLKPTQERDVVGPVPSVVLAHRLGIDESVFLARNQVRHPLFISGRVYG